MDAAIFYDEQRAQWMKGFTNVNQKISKLLDCAANFGSNSYIRQSHRHFLRAFSHGCLYTSASYELKWGVPDLYHMQKLHLKCGPMSEIGVFKKK